MPLRLRGVSVVKPGNAMKERDFTLEGTAPRCVARSAADRSLSPFGEAVCGLDRQQAHRLRPGPAATFRGVAELVGGVKVSKNSCSSIWRASRWAAAASSSPPMFIRARRFPCA